MNSISFVFTELTNIMKYGGGFLYNLVFTEWRHCVSQNDVWRRGCYITLFSPSDVTALHRMTYGEGCHITLFSPSDVTAFHRMPYGEGCHITLFSSSDVTEYMFYYFSEGIDLRRQNLTSTDVRIWCPMLFPVNYVIRTPYYIDTLLITVCGLGGGPGVVVSTAAFDARVRGSVPGLGGLKETKMFLPHPRVEVSIVGSLRDREVACSASDRQGSNFESCVWRTVSSHSSHHPQVVLLAQFSLYVHKCGLKPDSFHFICLWPAS